MDLEMIEETPQMHDRLNNIKEPAFKVKGHQTVLNRVNLEEIEMSQAKVTYHRELLAKRKDLITEYTMATQMSVKVIQFKIYTFR